MLRHPKTTQERRESCYQWFEEDNEDDLYPIQIYIPFRAKRNMENLVNAWDDCWGPRRRSWKYFRKTQYKV